MNETPDFQAATQAQQQTWSKGDFSVVANVVYRDAEDLADAIGIFAGDRVLDVATGSGNGALAAARRAWGNVVGVDFVSELLARGRERAAAERLEIEFVEGDAQDLPFGEAEFDVTMSIYGVMFAPDQEKAASELLRVTKPGGRIGVASWCPDGGLEKLFLTVMKHAGPPPPGVMPPVLWGTEDHVRQLFGDGISDLQCERVKSRQSFFSADHYIDVFRTYFGPIKSAYEKVGPEGEEALTADLRQMLEEANTAGDRGLVIEPEYLRVIATRA
ncbi:MAG TPA: methyltransferase domain-containing protein [Solirubrobacterales bacterium]|nr:methyltransferase domain-containing protein [Solirubrobacterales bacterium]